MTSPHAGERADSPHLVGLWDTDRATPDLVGAKAANLARSLALGLPVLPGFVILPHAPGDRERLLRPDWERLSEGGTRSLVVRSSSAAEDGETSSMAGRFTSVVDVRGWRDFLAAVERVVASAATGTGAPAARMSVLVQPFLDCAYGGVLFGVDPVSGRRDRLVVAATAGGPDRLVSGAVSGVRITLTPHGRVCDIDGDALPGFPTRRQRKALTRLAARVEHAFGGPQDVEWALDEKGELWLLQSRPITAVAARVDPRGPRFGPGPVAETFPEPLAPLELAMWGEPLRQALAFTLRLSGAAGGHQIAESPVLVAPGARLAVDLDLVEGRVSRKGWRRIDPRPSLRRLEAAWRVGRLRAALPLLAQDLVEEADRDLADVPPLAELSDETLLGLLRRGGEALVALHAQEMLAGLLSGAGAPNTEVTAAQVALRRLVSARVEDLADEDIISRYPEVLALTVPGVRPRTELPALVPASLPAAQAQPLPPREALRLRCRWVHELTGRAAFELGRRLQGRKVLNDPARVRLLDVDELERAILTGALPADFAGRALAAGPPLPAVFRLGPDGSAVAVPAAPTRGRRRKAKGQETTGRPAGGGRAVGRVHNGPGAPEPGAVLVVSTLDPGLAVHLPRLGGLVAETGSVLSHLAILAREFGVPTVVGVTSALNRFPSGSVVVVDGGTGEVSLVEGTG